MACLPSQEFPHAHVIQPTVILEQPNIVPPQGTIRRCEHSVYIGSADTRAMYCSYCSPGGPYDARPVTIAIDRCEPRMNGSCPQCGETAHYTYRTQWICAACHHKYPAPREVAGNDGN